MNKLLVGLGVLLVIAVFGMCAYNVHEVVKGDKETTGEIETFPGEEALAEMQEQANVSAAEGESILYWSQYAQGDLGENYYLIVTLNAEVFPIVLYVEVYNSAGTKLIRTVNLELPSTDLSEAIDDIDPLRSNPDHVIITDSGMLSQIIPHRTEIMDAENASYVVHIMEE